MLISVPAQQNVLRQQLLHHLPATLLCQPERRTKNSPARQHFPRRRSANIDIAHHVPSGLRENRPWGAEPTPPTAAVERQGPTLGVPASTLTMPIFGYFLGSNEYYLVLLGTPGYM